jgi:hypothetical protein
VGFHTISKSLSFRPRLANPSAAWRKSRFDALKQIHGLR